MSNRRNNKPAISEGNVFILKNPMKYGYTPDDEFIIYGVNRKNKTVSTTYHNFPFGEIEIVRWKN